jgi:hypothetical protein
MDKACSINGEKMNVYKILVVKSEGKIILARRRRKWVNTIKIDHKDIGWGGMDWTDLAQDRNQ